MDLVAREASVARRTVYNQFESKEALFIASVERVWSEFPVVEITADESVLSDPAAGLKRIGDAVVDFWEPPIAVAFLRMVIIEGTRFPDLPTTFFEAGKAPAMRALVEYLRTLSANRVLHVEDAELAASQFLGLLNEPLLWLRVIGIGDAPSKERREKVVAEGVSMFLSRYGKRQILPDS